MREWSYRDPAPRMEPGSEAHKQMFCEMLLATHNPYKPVVIDWPKLSPEALRRVTSLPIWDIAVQTEGRASMAVATYASTVRNAQKIGKKRCRPPQTSAWTRRGKANYATVADVFCGEHAA
jgi:hypothetical protein